jgi:hypothetical protein
MYGACHFVSQIVCDDLFSHISKLDDFTAQQFLESSKGFVQRFGLSFLL